MFLRKTRSATTTAAATTEPVVTEADATQAEVAEIDHVDIETDEVEMAEMDTPDVEAAQFVDDPAPTEQLRRKDLIERTAERSGLRKGEVKPALEAALEVLSEALDAGEGLILPPFGRIKVVKRKELEKGEVLIARIRRTTPEEKSPDDAIAQAAE